MIADTEDRQFQKLLDKHGLKKTKARLNILSVLSSHKAATSQPDLEKLIGSGVDSVTLYRALKTFEEKGIIHKVIDMNGTSNYAMCDNSCTDHHHNDHHVHFNCTVCIKVYCLDEVSLPEIPMPAGFTISSANLVAYGICQNCNNLAEKLNS